jgi:hypothetical protein
MRLRYWGFFASLAAGALLMLWNGVPMYRKFLSGDPDPGHRSILWALAVLALVQPAFWTIRRIRPPVPGDHLVAGHVVLFLGRMTFVFVSGVFSAVFYSRMGTMQVTPGRTGLLVAVLFSMFCVTQEVDRLGQTLSASRAPRDPAGAARAGSPGEPGGRRS